jgi:hypothetical protein
MFIRKKPAADGGTYYQLVANHREGGKVRQRVILSMQRCATIEERIAELERYLRYASGRWAEKFAGEVAKARQ